MEDGYVKVITPMDEQPAARAGIQSGDLSYTVDDTLIQGPTLQTAIDKRKGTAGTKAVLGIYGKGEGGPLTFSVTREIIPFWAYTFLGLALSTVVVAAVEDRWQSAIAVSLANLAAFGALWITKFLLLERWMFADRSDRAADEAIPPA